MLAPSFPKSLAEVLTHLFKDEEEVGSDNNNVTPVTSVGGDTGGVGGSSAPTIKRAKLGPSSGTVTAHMLSPADHNQLAKQCPFIYAVVNRILHRELREALLLPRGKEGEGKLTPQQGGLIGATALQQLDQLESLIFERLNTGHWKSVDGLWRRLYSLQCLLKVMFQLATLSTLDPSTSSPTTTRTTTADAIKTCDMGLLMGEPICDNILSRIAEEMCEACAGKQTTTNQEQPLHPSPNPHLHHDHQDDVDPAPPILRNKSRNEFLIQELTRPSLEQFGRLMTGGKDNEGMPAKLLGIVDHWPAVKRWNLEYIRERAGLRSVPVEIGQRYTSEDWTQKIMTINEFIDRFIIGNSSTSSPSPSQVGYVAQHTLFNQIPSIGRDIIPPDYLQFSSSTSSSPSSSAPAPPEINAWFGPANTISPTHHDPKHNILVQVFGTKVIRLFPPSESKRLRPYPEGSLLFNTSSLDVEAEDLFQDKEAGEGMREVVHCDLLLRGGEALFIPKGWWHYVKSTRRSCGASLGSDVDNSGRVKPGSASQLTKEDANYGASFSVSFWFD